MSDAAKNLPGRLAAADRTLIRQIGAAFLQILQGQLVPIPDSERPDGLGLLAGIATPVATETLHTRDRDARAPARALPG